jgi:hypothetical protein
MLEGATEFSRHPEIQDQLWAIMMLKRHPQWLDPLLTGTNLSSNFGRPRIEGHWALAYLAFVVSGHPDVQPWFFSTEDPLWVECGFQAKPKYHVVWHRFAELESESETFDEVAGLLIRQAVHHSDGRVGRDISLDGTEAQSNARAEHDCQPGDNCRRRVARYPGSLETSEVRGIRQHEAEGPPPEDIDDLILGEAELVETRPLQKGKRVKVGDCFYQLLDADAGCRAYKTSGGRVKKFWIGYYNVKAIDHFTGAPISILVDSASIQEPKLCIEILDRVTAATGETPRAIVGDKGLSTKEMFEAAIRRGISPVIPFRTWGRNAGRVDHEEFDRYGVPRCKHCGGHTRQVRFSFEPPVRYPRIGFKCEDKTLPACRNEQTIACSKGWNYLLPLPVTSAAYCSLRDLHSKHERVHELMRRRYRVGAKSNAVRPRRIGRGCQQLRASAAVLIEWLRIVHLQGWIGSTRRRLRGIVKIGSGKITAERLAEKRLRNGLLSPYGAKAFSLGLGPLRPGGPMPNAPPDPDNEVPF